VQAWAALLGGLIVLVIGAEMVVRSGTRVALRWSIPPVVIGLTIVSLGTSAPELAIGIDAALRGNGALAVGNIVGTNLVNLVLILGISAIILPIAVSTRTAIVDVPAVAVVSVMVVIVGYDRRLTTIDAAILLAAGLSYLLAIVATVRRRPVHDELADHPSVAAELEPAQPVGGSAVRDGLSLVLGLAVIVVGADFLVDGSVDLARTFGISEAVIGLTIVAIGTSAPELVTTIVSTIRGDRDIALGNLLGSSVLNLAIILGVTIVAAPSPIAIPAAVAHVDIPIMAVAGLLLVPIVLSGRMISRLEGAVFVAAYTGYFLYLLLART
jgi:cation:H+ antiporter